MRARRSTRRDRRAAVRASIDRRRDPSVPARGFEGRELAPSDSVARRATLTLAERSLGVASTPLADGWHEAGAPCSDAAGCVFPPFGPAAWLLQ
jgi:hypothetical protein